MAAGPTEIDASVDIIVRLLQFIAILQSVPKLAYYVRIYDAYITIVELLSRTMVEVSTFLSVFGFCLHIMTILFIIVGMEAPTEDDEDSVLRFTTGDITLV